MESRGSVCVCVRVRTGRLMYVTVIHYVRARRVAANYRPSCEEVACLGAAEAEPPWIYFFRCLKPQGSALLIPEMHRPLAAGEINSGPLRASGAFALPIQLSEINAPRVINNFEWRVVCSILRLLLHWCALNNYFRTEFHNSTSSLTRFCTERQKESW